MLIERGYPKAIGFIGLGNMGWWMCLNLRKGVPVSTEIFVFDIVTSIMDELINESQSRGLGEIHICESARVVAINSDILFTIVPEGENVRSVFLDTTAGIFSLGLEDIPGLLVDCSTIDIATSVQLAKHVQEMNACAGSDATAYYDAPVSGGTAGAEKGTLTFMVGAQEDSKHSELLRKVIGTMGHHIFFCGGPTKGLAVKLSNNYLSGVIAIATSEAMNLGIRLGVEPKLLQQCFSRSSGGNWVNDTVNPVPGVCPDAVTSRDYRGGFKIQLMKKDFGLAVESARAVGAKLILGDIGLHAYMEASEDARYRDRDSRIIYRWLGGQE